MYVLYVYLHQVDKIGSEMLFWIIIDVLLIHIIAICNLDNFCIFCCQSTQWSINLFWHPERSIFISTEFSRFLQNGLRVKLCLKLWNIRIIRNMFIVLWIWRRATAPENVALHGAPRPCSAKPGDLRKTYSCGPHPCIWHPVSLTAIDSNDFHCYSTYVCQLRSSSSFSEQSLQLFWDCIECSAILAL